MKDQTIKDIIRICEIKSSNIASNKRKIALFVFIGCMLTVVYFLGKYSPMKINISLLNIVIGVCAGGGILLLNYNITRLSMLFCSKKRPVIEINRMDLILPISYRLFSTIIIALLEELIFRSYLLDFTNSFLPLYISVVANSILFYLIHINKKIIELIAMSALFCIITICTNSILPAIIAHIINNILVVRYKYQLINKNKIKKNEMA